MSKGIPTDIITFIHDKDNINHERVDKYLGAQIKYLSRSQIAFYITEGYITINDRLVKPSYLLKYGDVIRIPHREYFEQQFKVQPQQISLDILYENDNFAIINKPASMIVHPAGSIVSGTLVNSLLFQFDNLSSLNGEERPGIVHRLDKDTTGLLVIAKNDKSHEFLAKEFSERNVKKTYLAIVHGKIDSTHGTINKPISRSKQDRSRMCVVSDGRPSITKFKVLASNDYYTFLEINLLTGRTHQIRVHMESINHPIVGDLIYSRYADRSFAHQLLHSYKLSFNIHSHHYDFVVDPDSVFKEALIKLNLSVT